MLLLKELTHLKWCSDVLIHSGLSHITIINKSLSQGFKEMFNFKVSLFKIYCCYIK